MPKNLDQKYLTIFGGIILLSVIGFVSLEEVLCIALPIAVLMAGWIAIDIRGIMLLFFFCLPFSIEVDIVGGLATDLPAEPFMLVFTGISLVLLFRYAADIKLGQIASPIVVLVGFHLFWILFCTLYSAEHIISIKFFIAKLWYVLPFFGLLPWLIDSPTHFVRLFRYLGIGIFITIIVVLIRHADLDFSFKEVHHAVDIFYRNHVNYACLIATFFPFWLLLMRYDRWLFGRPLIKLILSGLLLIAIYYSYTRAAMIAVFLILPIYAVIRWRLMKPALFLSVSVAVIFMVSLANENEYLDYAPDFNKTITHEKFDNLIDATAKLEDISTMERVYRWVAGAKMIAERPFVGFGPGSFSHQYKGYTVTSFRTYVSDNPEQSGMHNYYLMTAVEQGLPGLIIFLLLVIIGLIQGERLYHRLGVGFHRDLVLVCTIALAIILAINIMNDMIETAKQGPIFWMILGVISLYAARWPKSSDSRQRDQISEPGSSE